MTHFEFKVLKMIILLFKLENETCSETSHQLGACADEAPSSGELSTIPQESQSLLSVFYSFRFVRFVDTRGLRVKLLIEDLL